MWCSVGLSGVVVVGDVGVSPMTATFCEVHYSCAPYPPENLDHVWSWVGVWVVLTVLVIVVLLSRRPSRK